LGAVGQVVRSVAGRTVVRLDTIDARYARLHADSRLAASVTSGFGVVAFVVACSGIYAVMAFLVSARRREIGIRMALGANQSQVKRLVFRSSLPAAAAGIAFGLAAAALATRAVASQLFGVTATDVPTYIAVSAILMAAAATATWWPARWASLVDPAITLRAE
jgi:putative ABC transport system permease protein